MPALLLGCAAAGAQHPKETGSVTTLEADLRNPSSELEPYLGDKLEVVFHQKTVVVEQFCHADTLPQLPKVKSMLTDTHRLAVRCMPLEPNGAACVQSGSPGITLGFQYRNGWRLLKLVIGDMRNFEHSAVFEHKHDCF
jgi:hypothetical protein